MSVSAGTVLTFMCDDNLSFSDAVLKTYETGLFEDDCFLDLEGIEAAQKLLILGRSLGVPLELSDIEIEPLAKRREIISWQSISSNDIFKEENIKMKARADRARSNNCTLRYVQRIECSVPAELGRQQKVVAKASVKLEEVPLISPYAMVKGAVYHFSFHTERYRQHPLIVQGPLSDSANTASGIIGDVLRIAKSIGAKEKSSEALAK
jgi:homoserine dehydrogenase